MITVGSLFAGIGGIELGLERTGGFKTVWQVEIDDYARRVLEKHWPCVRRWDDVRTFPPEPVDEWGCDLICGGFPCQDISYAGKGAGLAGERSGLWYEFARVIGVVRPRYVLVENVAALLTRGLGDVLGTLASLGYDAEWSVVSACSLGAPHTRERLFIVAYPNDSQIRTHRRKMGRDRRKLQYVSENQVWKDSNLPMPVGMVNGISSRMDRLGCLGNAVVPQVAQFIGERILAAEQES